MNKVFVTTVIITCYLSISSMPSLKDLIFCTSKDIHGDFPGGPVAKTPHFQCRGLGFNSWSGNWIPQAATKTWLSQRNKYFFLKEENMVSVLCSSFLLINFIVEL